MFIGYNKNLNYREYKKLKEEFLKPGVQAVQIFSDILYLNKHIGNVSTCEDLKKIFKFMSKNLKLSLDKKHNDVYRTSKEIWISKYYLNSTELTLVFESIARQLNIPTIHLQMVNTNWKSTLKIDGNIEKHDACECFIDGKWIFVDPSLETIQKKYNHKNLVMFNEAEVCSYQIFSKSTDLFETGATTQELTTKTLQNLFKIKKKK